jgi:DNA polymerase I-like protein with 3'-5' exonuclease and polymerase domains
MYVYIGAGKTLRKMESNGPMLDEAHQAIVKRVAARRLKDVEDRLRRLTRNPNFNPASPAQVLYYLHDVFHLPKLSDIDEDFASDDGEEDEGTTEENALVRIYQETGHEFPKLILERRKYDSYEHKYADAYKSSAEHWDGEVRTKFHLAGAASGRLRSGGGKRKKNAKVKFVNLQNITRTPFIKNLLCSDPQWRKLLVWLKPVFTYIQRHAPPISGEKSSEWTAWRKEHFTKLLDIIGHRVPEAVLALTIFCTFDLSQAELRVLALFSRDPELIAMFNDGRDVHCLVGEALGLGTYDDIKNNKELRANIKALNFGLVYGLEAVGLYWYMKGLGATASMEEVEQMRARYFQRFRGVGTLIAVRHEQWRRDGYIDTPYHFRRWMGPAYEPGRKTNWDNISMNSPIQGTAHMLMLLALHILSIQPKRYRLLSGVSMEIHDALVVKGAVRDLPQTYPMMQDLMEKQTVRYTRDKFGYNIDVPIVAEGGIGFRYGVELETPDFSDGLAKPLLEWALKNAETEAMLAAEFGYDAPSLVPVGLTN